MKIEQIGLSNYVISEITITKSNGLIMVTHDTTHFKRLQGIKLEDWTYLKPLQNNV